MTTLNRRHLVTGSAAALALGGLAMVPRAALADTPDLGGRDLQSAGPGKKWDTKGNAQRFRGNTFVCPVSQKSAFWDAQVKALELMKESTLAWQYGVLPPQSLHMTVFEGINQDRLVPGKYPAWMGEITEISEATRAILRRLQWRPRAITPIGPLRMKFKRLWPLEEGFVIDLEPADRRVEESLWQLRRQLRDLLRIDPPTFDTYQFHSSLGYRLFTAIAEDYAPMREYAETANRLFTGAAAFVELEPPAFNAFDDMLAFPQLWPVPTAM